jgi:hypothetical protein
MPTISPFRPRVVVRVDNDRSLWFAASCDVEIILVGSRCPTLRAFPKVEIGIDHVRRLINGKVQRDRMSRRAARPAGR